MEIVVEYIKRRVLKRDCLRLMILYKFHCNNSTSVSEYHLQEHKAVSTAHEIIERDDVKKILSQRPCSERNKAEIDNFSLKRKN